ncbi:tRNA lysidine(34) synthetase TilS [Taylorella equigenitalis]|uniref:tRNA lysidine(34) synthetase TilS n=1 Tax=Taylorella equigenitalis TaxID=29575 RepID=UPI0004240DBD|nr:tRNA lysidine(34) synthetase TilS [Taylorella equigenitalis]WDU48403.1 tRNA lysidine(34) synthetase TilS [Taylorella equigenitalis]
MVELQKKSDQSFNFEDNQNKLNQDFDTSICKYFFDSNIDSVIKDLSSKGIRKIGIAFSGGKDSVVLAIQSKYIATRYGVEVHLIHVHHGLYAEADEWVQRNLKFAERFGFLIHILYVNVPTDTNKGVEAAARQARYKAITDKCKELGIGHVFTGHHIDDQSETILIRLLRGTGILGIKGIPPKSEIYGIKFHRPWLNSTPTYNILELIGHESIKDPSNFDSKYARGAVRNMFDASIASHFPLWQKNVARFAQVCVEVDELTRDLAILDAESVGLTFNQKDDMGKEVASLDLQLFRSLPTRRQINLIRYIFKELNVLNPTHSKTTEIIRQLNGVHQMGTDRNLNILHENLVIKLCKGMVVFNKVKGN